VALSFEPFRSWLPVPSRHGRRTRSSSIQPPIRSRPLSLRFPRPRRRPRRPPPRHRRRARRAWPPPPAAP
jgi:hypothetical protein